MMDRTSRFRLSAGGESHEVAIMVLFVAAIALFAGCDDGKPKSPADLAPQQTTTADPATQPADGSSAQSMGRDELAPMPLGVIPFTLGAPRGWKVKVRAGVMTLEGPTVAGTAQIQVARHVQPIAGHADRLVEGAKKEIAAEPGPYNKCDVRTVGGVQVLEFRKLGRATGAPVIDATGKQIAPSGTSMQWKLTAFVRRGGGSAKDVDMCEIGFVDLTREQYDIDKELLEKMIASLKYEPGAVSN
jgi:hypothetical protein